MRPTRIAVRLVAWLVLLAGAAGAEAAQWSPDQFEVPAGSSAALGVSGKAAAVDGEGFVHLAYQAVVGSQQSIMYTRRSPTGEWSAPLAVSDPSRDGRNASTVVDASGLVHVFWEDRATVNDADSNILHRVRNDDGTWQEVEPLFPSPGSSVRPVAASDPFGRVHLAWADSRFSPQTLQTRTVYTVLENGVWSPLEVLSPGAGGASNVSVDVDGLGRVHIVWAEFGSDGQTVAPEILYVRLDPDVPHEGIEVTHLVKTTYALSSPFVTVMPDGTVHLIWLDGRDAPQGDFSEIYYKRLLPDIGWGKDKRFTYDEKTHLRPIIVRDPEGSLNVLWEDYRQGNPEIYYRQITWETGWDRTATRLTTDNSTSRSPSLVALSDGGLIVFWTDTEAGGSSRIFTKFGSVR